MSADRVFAIRWTETALKLVEAVPDQRIRRPLSQRVDQLGTSPEQQGKALIGELAGFHSVRAVGQERRLRTRQEAPASATAPLTSTRLFGCEQGQKIHAVKEVQTARAGAANPCAAKK
jgi:hypothetical protein